MKTEFKRGMHAVGRKFAGLVVATAIIASGPGALAQDALTKFRVAGTEGINHATPFFVAVREGFFEEAGLEVEFITLGSAGAPMQAALAAGEVDIAMAGAGQFMSSIAHGINQGKIVGVNSDSNYLLLVRDGITDVSQLKGLSFGISGQNSGDHLWARAVVEHFGVDESEVSWIALGNPATRLAALSNGTVDAIQMNAASMPSEARKFILLNEDQSPVRWLSNGFFARQDIIDNQKPELQKFLAAVGKGSDFARAHPDAALAACMDTGSQEDVCQDVIKFMNDSKNPYNWSSTMAVPRVSVEAMIPSSVEGVAGAENLKFEDFVDTSIAGETP